MDQKKEVGILGVGNLLLRDEGFGVHVIRFLQENYSFPDEVELMDGGTLGLMLGPFFERVKRVIVIDVVALKDEPGSVHRFLQEDLRAGQIQARMSPHQIGVLEILELCKLRGMAPDEVEFVGVVPKDLSAGTGLSPALAPAVPKVAHLVVDRLAELGYEVRPQDQG